MPFAQIRPDFAFLPTASSAIPPCIGGVSTSVSPKLHLLRSNNNAIARHCQEKERHDLQ